jgi:dihydrofolate synthase / folylpolyglutamate synthase
LEHSTTLLARLLSLHPKLIDLSLDRIIRLLGALGDPQRRLPPVIHVAGTNGKGSTIAFMRAMLEAAGLSVHVYTSPHLVHFHERIRIGQAGGSTIVSEALLADALARCEAANAGQPMTFFEMTTAAALLLFSEHPADLVLFEVGLGGRFDATNVIEQALVTVITPVSIDHTDFLGSDIRTIAAEKGGIIKARTPVVIARQEHEGSEAVLEHIAERLHAPLVRYGQEYHVIEENGRLVYQDETGLLDLPLPKMAGEHQLINAGTAIATLRHAGFSLTDSTMFERGITKADWPARMQNLGKGVLAARLPPDSELWLDGGHNLDGGRVLAQALTRLNTRHPRPLVLIAGMLASKDSVGFLMNFKDLAPQVFAVGIAGQTASRPAPEVADHARQAGLSASIAGTIEEALQQISQQQWPVAPRVVICGSLYLAGDALARNLTPPQ